MIESILSLICWVWLPALLVSLHHSEWRRQFGLYEWMSLCQRLGDGTDPTVMSLQRQGEERELLWDLPFIGLSPSLPLCTHPQFSCPVMGSCYKLVTHPPLPHSGNFHASEMLLRDHPQPGSALPVSAWFSPTEFGCSLKNPNFMLVLWCRSEEG